MRRSLGVSCIALLVGAALGAPAAARPEPAPRLPNLLVYAPSSLIGPITGRITTFDARVDDPVVIDGCLPEERAQGAGRCLRYTTRVGNFDRTQLLLALRAEPSGMNAYQVVPGARGDTYRPAGTFSADPIRRELQLDGFLVTRLWSVRDGRKVEVVAETEPRGFCPDSVWFGLPGSSPYGECTDLGARMGPAGPEKLLGLEWLQHVWIESHEPGQYIDITGVPDGRYALEIEIDAGDNIAESYEPDNVTCVEMELRGTRVETFGPRLCWPPRT